MPPVFYIPLRLQGTYFLFTVFSQSLAGDCLASLAMPEVSGL